MTHFRERFLYLIAGVISAAVLVLLALLFDLTPPRIILTLAGPVLKVASWSGDYIRQGFEHYVYLVRLKEENRDLREENQRLRSLVVRLQEKARICADLQTFEEKKLFPRYPRVLARVIYNPLNVFEGYLIIDRGKRDGLAPEMPVVSVADREEGGLVGQVVEVADHYAKVLPLVSPEAAVEVYDLRSQERGILKGQGLGRPLLLDYVPYGADLREGDLLVTSGLDALYPPGIRVGRILKILPQKRQGFFQVIRVAPLVEVRKLRYVMVLLVPREFQP